MEAPTWVQTTALWVPAMVPLEARTVLWALVTTQAIPRSTMAAMAPSLALAMDVVLDMVVTLILVLALEDTATKHRLKPFFENLF